MPFLELDGTLWELQGGETTVGSGEDATLRVDGRGLTANHFVVSVDVAGVVELRACSEHGVVVLNGSPARLEPISLGPGDVIAAGAARFRYLADESASDGAAPLDDGRTAHLIDEDRSGAYPLSAQAITIGRDTSSVIRIRNPRVSRFHADVRAEAGVHVLYPFGAGATRVNGKRIRAPHVLEEGDRIDIGGTVLRFTRAPLPGDVHPADAEWELNDSQAMRATLLHGAVTSGERPVPRRSPPLWLLVTAAVLLAAIGYLVLA